MLYALPLGKLMLAVWGDRNRRCDNVDVEFDSDDSDVMLSGFDCILALGVVRDMFIALQMISLASLGKVYLEFKIFDVILSNFLYWNA